MPRRLATMIAIGLLILFAAAHCRADNAILAPSRFGPQPPAGWEMGKGWVLTDAGATATNACTATRSALLPSECWIDAQFDLPDADALAKGAALTLKLTPPTGDAGTLILAANFAKPDCTITLSTLGADGKPAATTEFKRDTRPSMARELKEAEKHPGWAGQHVSLGLLIGPRITRVLLNGCVVGELSAAVPADGRLSLTAKDCTLRVVSLRPCPPARYVYLSGAGVAAFSGGACRVLVRDMESPNGYGFVGEPWLGQIEVHGVPMLIKKSDAEVAALDIAAERYHNVDWDEGNGFLRAPVPARPYSAAYLLLRRRRARPDTLSAQQAATQPSPQAAMGFGIRPLGLCAGDLKNIYLDGPPETRPDEGVTIERVPSLGPDWYLARVPLNPAAFQWYTHDPDGKLKPPGAPTQLEAYFCRPWLVVSGLPRPGGGESELAVASVTLEESPIDLTVTGNGLGNVYNEPDHPHVEANLRNLSDQPLTVTLARELTPFDEREIDAGAKVHLGPGESQSIDALPQPIAARGHYHLRVLAQTGAQTGDKRDATAIDYRTEVALLAPDTRKKIDSPFGCWSELNGDTATKTQRQYLKDKAGVGFVMGLNNYDVRMDTPIPDDATAEALVKKAPPQAHIFMFGWEQTWSMDQTFAFPRIISEGKAEVMPKDIIAKQDKVAADWRRLAKAVRKLRPDMKISLGNSAVNLSVPFLERGYKPGVEFDYFGTEEGIFDETPEEPTDAIGNINWWTQAVCAHYGFLNVPLFHSETIYLPTGPGFSLMPETVQAGNYVRTYMLGFPYRSIFGCSAAIIDSGNGYVYSIWGMAGYCNQAPECSPKLSYVTFATLTQMLDGAKYEGRLDTGTNSLYALRFRRADGTPVCAIWNLRGERRVTAHLGGAGPADAVDALNRPLYHGSKPDVELTASSLPTYITGMTVDAVTPGANIPDAKPEGEQIAKLDAAEDWTVDTEPDAKFQAAREWRGMPKVPGPFTVSTGVTDLPKGQGDSLEFDLAPLPGTHPLIPRYVSLTAKPGKEIPLPHGTTRVGLWLRGNSTWAQVKIGIRNAQGKTRLLLEDDLSAQMADNFDGWRFVSTPAPEDEELLNGDWKVYRLVVTMPESQVYVDELRATPLRHINLWGLRAIRGQVQPVNYLPW